MEKAEIKFGKCKGCDLEKDLKLVYFKENISYFFSRTEIIYSGYYCFNCIKRIFYKTTRRTFFGTWWGVVGGVLGPGIPINNITEYIKSKKHFRNKR
jgi:hypothetical protein